MTTPNTDTKTDLAKGNDGTTKLVAPQPEKKVKLRILRDCADPRGKDINVPNVLRTGEIVEVDVKTAKELLNRKHKGIYEFSGQRESIEKLGVIRVAERYVEPLPEEDDEVEGA